MKLKTIRHKLLIAVIVLTALIGALGYSSFRGAYAYRDLAVILSQRSSELPATAELTRAIDDLQNIALRAEQAESLANHASSNTIQPSSLAFHGLKSELRSFSFQLVEVRQALSAYRNCLTSKVLYDPLLSDRTAEQEMVVQIEKRLDDISDRNNTRDLIMNPAEADQQREDLQKLSLLAHRLPTFLYERMSTFREDVRSRYSAWIVIAWSSIVFTFLLLFGLCVYVRMAVIAPIKTLL